MSEPHISMDEWWPVFSIQEYEDYGPLILLTPPEKEAYRKAMDDFNKWQKRLGTLFRKWEEEGRP